MKSPFDQGARTDQRAWMRLPSGMHLDLISPDPQAWTDEDLATRLSRTYRWGGESCWPVPMSVAQHSLQVLELSKQWTSLPLAREEALRELLHDAEEGFLGFDCIAPLKQVLGPAFKLVTDRLTDAVWERYELPAWDAVSYDAHKWADITTAASEAVHCVGWSVDEVRSVLGIRAPILSVDPLASRYDCQPWAPWPSDVAAQRFLDAMAALVRERAAAGERGAPG